MKKLTVLALLSFIVSCTSKSNSQLILGSWSMHIAKPNATINLNFIDKNTLIVNFKVDNKDEIDSMNYKLINNEKKLITTEKNGDVEEFEIAKLSGSNLLLIKGNDTLDLKKD